MNRLVMVEGVAVDGVNKDSDKNYSKNETAQLNGNSTSPINKPPTPTIKVFFISDVFTIK